MFASAMAWTTMNYGADNEVLDCENVMDCDPHYGLEDGLPILCAPPTFCDSAFSEWSTYYGDEIDWYGGYVQDCEKVADCEPHFQLVEHGRAKACDLPTFCGSASSVEPVSERLPIVVGALVADQEWSTGDQIDWYGKYVPDSTPATPHRTSFE